MANYVLEILDGDRAGEVLPVGDATLRIGRKPGNDVVLADEKTSGVHCEIAPEDGRLVLQDLGSTNGTFLDGKRVSEIVLTPGDVVTVGRVRVRFRSSDDDAAAANDDEFAVRRLDASRLQKRGSSIGLLVALLVVLAAGGGYYWWSNQQAGDTGDGGKPRIRAPLAVAGNLLDPAIAACESEEGWSLTAAGLGFRPTGDAHTGTGAFAAYHFAAEDGADDEAGHAGDQQSAAGDEDYAVMELATPLRLLAGRTVTISAHIQTRNGALATVRARLFGDGEQAPFRFVHGAPLEARDDGYSKVEAVATVPTGCDQLQVEVVAVLPNPDSEVLVDDVAIVAGGTDNAIAAQLGSRQTVFGCGSAIAVRSIDVNDPVIVHEVAPAEVPPALRQLYAAGLCALSDVGGSVSVVAGDNAATLEVGGVDGFALVVPADAVAGLMAAGDDGRFHAVAAHTGFEARRVLFGSHATRALLELDQTASLSGRTRSGRFWLQVPATSVRLVLGFREQRQRAVGYLAEARHAWQEGRPGEALDRLKQLFETAPMDSEQLALAQELRNQLLTEQAERSAQLRRDLDEAKFFNTRGGFERVIAGVDELIALYGEANVEDLAGLTRLREAAQARLQAIDRALLGPQRERLTALADAFAEAGQPELEKMVRGYIARHLPDAPPSSTSGSAPEGGPATGQQGSGGNE